MRRGHDETWKLETGACSIIESGIEFIVNRDSNSLGKLNTTVKKYGITVV